jgi:FkbM family methyltransferase
MIRQLIKKFIPHVPLLNHLYKNRIERLQFAEAQSKARNLEIWKSLFADGEDKIIHKIDDTTSIYLFKDSVLSRLIYEGQFELDEIAFVKEYLKEGEIFIDIGSNIGLFSLVASNKVGSTGKVVAFEPSPVTYNRLKQNARLAKYQNIEIRNLGLSNTESTLTLNISGAGYDAWDTFSVVEAAKRAGQVEVPVSTLDNQLQGLNKTKISIIKIDVEGWEKFVLLGAQEFLKGFAPILLVEFAGKNTDAAGYKASEIYDTLGGWGYEWYSFKNNQLRTSKKKAEYSDENLIAIKKMHPLPRG